MNGNGDGKERLQRLQGQLFRVTDVVLFTATAWRGRGVETLEALSVPRQTKTVLVVVLLAA